MKTINKVEQPIISFNTKMMSTEEFTKTILLRVKERKSFSFIRLGDGEGALLDLDLNSIFFDIKYLSEHFGLNCSINEAFEIKAILKETLMSSDIVGIRDDIVNVDFPCIEISDNLSFMTLFKKSFKLRDVDKNLCYADARRIAMLHRSVAASDFSSFTKFNSAYDGWDFYCSGALPYILSTQNKIGIVSSRIGIDKIISDALSIEVVQYQIPDKYELVQSYKKTHYPTTYHEVLDNINVAFPGMIFLVAGGIVGKGYCKKIKELGGIALDLGSVVDTWTGKLTRPNLLKERYKLKKSFKIKMRRKFVPTVIYTYDLPDELIMNKNNMQLLIKRWKSKTQ
jgi:hypothetical protein